MIETVTQRPRASGLIIGAIAGAVIGMLLIPNFGVASRGGGIGVWGWVFGACLGSYIGFRIGEWIYRRAPKTARRQQD